MGILYALEAAAKAEWKNAFSTSVLVSLLLGSLPIVLMFSWIGSRGPDDTTVTYVLAGVFLFIVWNQAFFRIGWSVSGELLIGTLDLAIVSKTPLTLITLGKSFSLLLLSILGAGLMLGVGVLVNSGVPELGNVLLVFISLVITTIGVMVCCFIFSPIMVLMGGRGGFLNGFSLGGIVLSGFLYPIDVFPVGLEALSRVLPTSWGMIALYESTKVDNSIWQIAGHWAVALAITVIYILATWVLFGIIERRVRKTASLGSDQ